MAVAPLFASENRTAPFRVVRKMATLRIVDPTFPYKELRNKKTNVLSDSSKDGYPFLLLKGVKQNGCPFIRRGCSHQAQTAIYINGWLTDY